MNGPSRRGAHRRRSAERRRTRHPTRLSYLRWYIEKAQSHPEVPRLTAERIELLDLIDSLANDPEIHLDMEFQPGDLQLLANHSILHARTAYEDHEDPARRRHLLRLWMRLCDVQR